MSDFTDLTNGSGSVSQAQLVAMDEVRDVSFAPLAADFLSTDIYIRDTTTNFLYELNNGESIIVGSNKITKLSSVTANAIARWDNITKELKDSSVTIDDNDNINVAGIPLLESANNSLDSERLKVETHVFILAGQSNSIGRCAFDGGEDYPTGVMQYDRTGNIVQAVSPLDHHDETAGSMGMSVSFAIEYMKVFPNVTLIFIPQGIGGSSFGANHWNKGDFFYEDLVSRVNTFTASNPLFKLKGMLWHQGENDAVSATYANAYQNALDTGMTNFKADITAWDNNFKVILGGIYAGWVGVNADRLKVQGIIEDTPNRLNNFYWVSSEEPTPFGDIGDNIHFDAKSQRLFGRRYLKSYLGAIGYSTRTDSLLEGSVVNFLNISPEESGNSSGEYYVLTDPTTALKIKTTNYQSPMVVESTGGGWAPASQAFIASGSNTRGMGTYYRNNISNDNFFIGAPYQHTDDFVISYNNLSSFSMALAQTSYSIMKINGVTGNMFIGDGTANANEKLEVKGNALLNPIVGEAIFEVRSAINLDARVKMRETANGAYGTDFYYKGSTNQFAIEGINNFSSRGLHLTVERDSGFTAIGLDGVVPTERLEVGGNVKINGTLRSILPLNPGKINVLVDSPQNTTAYTGTYGQLQLSNSSQTDGNYARLDFGDGDPQASASLGAKLINHALNYADLDFYTRGADGLKSRMKIGSNGKIVFYNNISSDSSTINQSANSVGLQINGFDLPAEYLKIDLDVSGFTNINASKGFRTKVNNINVSYTSQYGNRFYDDKYMMFGNGDDFRIKYNATTDKLQIGVGNADNLSIDTSGNVAMSGALLAVSYKTGAISAYYKYGLWGGSTSYAIGMKSGCLYGSLSNFATTFTMGVTAGMGWLWRTDTMAIDEGSMSLSTDGKLTVLSDVNVGGQLSIAGGVPGAGKVLTSDATGLATWETPSSGGSTTLDDSTTAIAFKELTATTGAIDTSIDVVHGIASNKILSISVRIESGGSSFETNDTLTAGVNFSFKNLDSFNKIRIQSTPGQSSGLASKLATIFITYKV